MMHFFLGEKVQSTYANNWSSLKPLHISPASSLNTLGMGSLTATPPPPAVHQPNAAHVL